MLPVVHPIGISPPRHVVEFEPGLDASFSHRIVNKRDAKIEAFVNITGELSEYITLKTPANLIVSGGGTEKIAYTLSLPERMSPGNHTARIRVSDNTLIGEGMFQLKTMIIGSITLIVPVYGRYCEIELNVPDINEDEIIYHFVNIENLGEEDIEGSALSVEYFDSDNNKLKEFDYEDIDLRSLRDTTITDFFESAGFQTGEYEVKAEYHYGGDKPALSKATLRVGTYDVEITGYGEELYAGEITPLPVIVKSNWNSEIEKVHVSVDINEKNYRSPDFSLASFEEKELILYIDDESLELGESYQAEIELAFGNESRVVKTDMRVVEKPAEGEEEKTDMMFLLRTPTTYILTTVVILIMVNIFFLLKKHKKKNKK